MCSPRCRYYFYIGFRFFLNLDIKTFKRFDLFTVGVPTSPTSLTVNNLLLGKSAIVSSRGRRLGPPPGAVPPSRTSGPHEKTESKHRPRSTDTISWKEEKSRKSLSRRNSVKWKDIKNEKVVEKCRKASIDFDETGDGIIVSEREANEMIASLRSRSSSETSSYSSHSASSTDTSLCDENERASDSDHELPDDDKQKKVSCLIESKLTPSPILKASKVIRSPVVKGSKIARSPHYISKTIAASEKPVKDIADYLDSAAGEPLRTYIDGFETKLKDNQIPITETDSYKPLSPLKILSPYSPRMNSENEILQRLNRPNYEENSKSSDSIRPVSLPNAKKFTDLSPIDLSSPLNYRGDHKSPYNFDFITSFQCAPTPKLDINSRQPDIIDSLTMYPNFVPDIDLSDKNVSDVDSLPRSPGGDSIIVSEDEPPIPLKIDKYFEHSPEFFGARLTDPNNSDIPNRRSTKRNSRVQKKPDSLTLQSSHNDTHLKENIERASSLPQSHSFTISKATSPQMKETSNVRSYIQYEDKNETSNISCNTKVFSPIVTQATERQTSGKSKECHETMSPKDYILQSGRKNSERALQIIQENSKILSRILTKQNLSETIISTKIQGTKRSENLIEKQHNIISSSIPEKHLENKSMDSPLLKESTSDSLIGLYRKRNINNESGDKNDFMRVRPISIDDPFSLETRNTSPRNNEFNIKDIKTPSTECLTNKTDLYGWENKGFLAKCDYKTNITKPDVSYTLDYKRKTCDLSSNDEFSNNELKPVVTSEWTRHSFSGESKTSLTLNSTEPKDTSYDRKLTSEDFNYPFSSKYNDYVLSKASDICSKTVDQGPKICENISKTDNSQVSDFAHVVTSSISFTYEPSAEDDSPIEAKSNSSDTLCQITSLDQVSTPISPKIFPNKETPTLPREYIEKSDKLKFESDDTCSAITSLIETDTLSSLSYPRSPSTGSYHPFPTRPAIRLPKEIGVRLGMYPKDALSSPPK